MKKVRYGRGGFCTRGVWDFMSAKSPSDSFSRLPIRRPFGDRPNLFLEMSVDGVHVIDERGILVECSDSFARSLGYSREDMIGMHVSEWDARWSSSELSEIIRINLDLPPTEIATFESLHRRKDGVCIPVEIRARLLRVGDENFFLNSSREISAQKISESRIRRLSELNVLLASAGAAMAEARDEYQFIQILCDLCVRHAEFSLAWIGQPDREGCFVPHGSAGEVEYLDGIKISSLSGIPEGEGPTGRSFRENRSIFNNDFSTPDMAPWVNRAYRFGIRSSASLPIRHEGDAWGVLTVYHRDPDAFGPEVWNLLEELARIASRGFDLVRNRRIEKETTAFKAALLDSTLAGIALVQNDRFVMVNNRFQRIFGLEGVELGEVSVGSLFLEGHVREKACPPETMQFEEEVLIPDVSAFRRSGGELFVDLSVHPLPGTQTMVWTVVDVSERHHLQERNSRISRFNLVLARANQALATQTNEESLLRELCELGVRTGGLELACIGVPDENGWIRLLAASGKREFLEGVRFSVREEHPEGLGAVGMAFRTGTAQFNETFALTSFWKERAREFGFRSGGVLPVLRGGKPWGVFIVYYRKEKVLLSDLKIILEELAINVSRGLDILELQRFRSILSRALEAVSDGAVVTGVDRRILFSNRAFTSITGYGPQELIGRDCGILLGVGSDPMVSQELEKAVRSGYSFESELLFYRKDGSSFWNHLSITPVRNEDGVLTHFVEIHRDVTQVRRMADRLSFESRHDDLTGLPNRRSLESHLDRVLIRAARLGTSIAVGVLDLDDFKPVNDRYGHEAGDLLLKDFSMRVRSRLRETDFLARLGGDEFVLVIEDLSPGAPDSQIVPFLDRLHEAVETPFVLPSGESATVGMSLGVAIYPDEGVQGDELIRKADLSMYAVKDRRHQKNSWWNRGIPGEKEESQSSFDPFGPDADTLLGRHSSELEKLQERFVEDFYSVLALTPEAKEIFSSLTTEEIKSLKERQKNYLAFLFRPRMEEGHDDSLSRRLGEVHALIGVPDNLLLRSKFLYSRLLVEHLDRTKLSVRDRLHLYLAIEGRLDKNFEIQLDGSRATIDGYFSVLSVPSFEKTLEGNVARNELERLSALPGIQGSFLLDPDDMTVMEEAENSTGNIAAKWNSDKSVFFQALKDLLESVKKGDVYSGPPWITGPGTMAGQSVADSFAIRSILAVPVFEQNRVVRILVLLGCYPNQFASSWMQRFINGLSERWGRETHS